MFALFHGLWGAIAALWVLWVLFVLTMGFYRAKMDGRLKGLVLVMAAPWWLLGWLLDFMVNVTLASVIFLDPPRELLVTGRLQRYVAGGGWRRKTAAWVCENLLDVFDPTGDHC